MNLCINHVIEWLGSEDAETSSKFERILWVKSESNKVITIELIEKSVMPKLQQYDHIVLEVENGNARIVSRKEHYRKGYKLFFQKAPLLDNKVCGNHKLT